MAMSEALQQALAKFKAASAPAPPKPALTNRERVLRKKDPNRTRLDLMHDMERVKLRDSYSPWISEAVILHITNYTCRCGQEFHAPASRLHVRMRHKTNGTIWHVKREEGLIPPDLPRYIEQHQASVEACQYCYFGRGENPAQAELFNLDAPPYPREARVPTNRPRPIPGLEDL